MTISTLTAQIQKTAEAARASGQHIEVDFMLPSITIYRSENDQFSFQEHEAAPLLKEANEIIKGLGADGTITAADFLLYSAQNW